MKIKTWIRITIGAVAGAAFIAQANVVETVDFSTYPDGLLKNQPGWFVSGTTSSTLEWRNEAGKSITSTSAYTRVFNTAIVMSPTYSTYSMGLAFQFDITGAAPLSKDPVFAGIVNVNNKYADMVAIGLRRDVGTSCRLIYTIAQAGRTSVGGSLGSFSVTDLDSDNNGSTDALWMGVTIARGATANDWVMTGILSNMTSGVTIKTGSAAFVSNEAFFTNDLMALMAVGCSDAESNVANRAISEISISAIPEPTTVGLFMISGVGCLLFRRLTLL